MPKRHLYPMNNKELFLKLVRLGIGNEPSPLPKQIIEIQQIEWNELYRISGNQGLTALVLDGLDKLAALAADMPQTLRLEWIGEVLQNYEQRFSSYEKAISSLAGFYNQHGIKMMVFKGYACATNWPRPEHRPCGDIDIWQFGEQKRADVLIDREKGVKVDDSLHHHTVFEWKGFEVENHYDFINVHNRRNSKRLNELFKTLAKDDSFVMEVKGEKVYQPSPNLHALYLIRHMAGHFASIGINLRQLLDWAFFARNHKNEIGWKWLHEVLEEYKMKDFFNCINAICVEELGFESSIFHNVQFSPFMKDKVLNDILEPEFSQELPKRLLPRVVYKYRRWKGNAWKQELCFGGNRLSLFLTGLWSHILKPKTI